jgi:hypothetical protein
MLDRDKVNSVSPYSVRVASVSVIDALQDQPAEVQPIAAAVVFLLLAEHYRMPAQDLFAVTHRIMRDPEGGRHPEFRAVAAYIKNELPCSR